MRMLLIGTLSYHSCWNLYQSHHKVVEAGVIDITKSDPFKDICIIPVFPLPMVGFQIDNFEPLPKVINEVSTTEFVVRRLRKHKIPSNRSQLHNVAKYNQRSTSKRKIILKNFSRQPKVYLIQHVGINEADFIYDD